MLKEFKEFAVKGNMIDMAVGIIIGAAFGTVVKSLVDDMIMPLISGIFRVPDFSNLFVVLVKPEVMTGVDMTSIAAVREAGGVALGYGLFINAIIAFLLVSLALFFVVKTINKMKKEKPVKEEPTGPSEVELLTEIRDALKK
ncbi:large conductance mechanosensitive channel protein MscL [Candidatus Nomurabacteria bacterium]|nr:large conductance mechanosensitive channel protein MscL [Candidatus Nomurabacteria bacterium]